MELFPVGSNFIVGTWNGNAPAPLYFLKWLGGENFALGNRLFRGLRPAIHPRHAIATDLNGDGIDDFVIADHGMDKQPFPGGKSQILWSKGDIWESKNVRTLTDQPAFTYHFAASSSGKPKFLFQSILGGVANRKGPAIWEIDSKSKLVERMDVLPEMLKDGRYCFMAATLSDLDNDSQDELILGLCDRPKEIDNLRSDVIFRYEAGVGFTPLPFDTLPPRAQDPTWGTAHFEVADFNLDGRKDILALPHNFGFSESVLQIYFQDGKLRFPRDQIIYRSPKDSFVIWASVGDINGDGFLDIAFALKFKDQKVAETEISYRLLMNRNGKKFEDVSASLPFNRESMVGIYFLPNRVGTRQSLFALDFLGNYHIIKMK